MTTISPLNGTAAMLAHAAADAAERLPDESLHDFLLRRHDAMALELATIQAEFTWQGQHLHAERLAADRRRAWLIAGLALDATLALLLCLAGLLGGLPGAVTAITLVILLAGNLLAVGMPRLDPVLAGLRAWTDQ